MPMTAGAPYSSPLYLQTPPPPGVMQHQQHRRWFCSSAFWFPDKSHRHVPPRTDGLPRPWCTCLMHHRAAQAASRPGRPRHDCSRCHAGIPTRRSSSRTGCLPWITPSAGSTRWRCIAPPPAPTPMHGSTQPPPTSETRRSHTQQMRTHSLRRPRPRRSPPGPSAGLPRRAAPARPGRRGRRRFSCVGASSSICGMWPRARRRSTRASRTRSA